MAINIEKAIKTQVKYLEDPFLNFHPVFREALQLGIEALKRELKVREVLGKSRFALLPGETEE